MKDKRKTNWPGIYLVAIFIVLILIIVGRVVGWW